MMPASNEDRERALRFLMDDFAQAQDSAKDLSAAGKPLLDYLMQEELMEVTRINNKTKTVLTLEGVVFVAWMCRRSVHFAEEVLDFITMYTYGGD